MISLLGVTDCTQEVEPQES